MRGRRFEHRPEVTQGDLRQTVTRATRRGRRLSSRALKDLESERLDVWHVKITEIT